MKVINLFAGPGAGKSTTAAGLFFLMKTLGYRVELVTEFAKDLTYEGGQGLDNQLAVLAEQDKRLRRLIGKVDYAITDSPLLLSLIYRKSPFTAPWFTLTVTGLFHSYQNRSVLIRRCKPYAAYGRSQTEAEAQTIDRQIERLLADHNVFHITVNGDQDAPQRIFANLQDSP